MTVPPVMAIPVAPAPRLVPQSLVPSLARSAYRVSSSLADVDDRPATTIADCTAPPAGKVQSGWPLAGPQRVDAGVVAACVDPAVRPPRSSTAPRCGSGRPRAGARRWPAARTPCRRCCPRTRCRRTAPAPSPCRRWCSSRVRGPRRARPRWPAGWCCWLRAAGMPRGELPGGARPRVLRRAVLAEHPSGTTQPGPGDHGQPEQHAPPGQAGTGRRPGGRPARTERQAGLARSGPPGPPPSRRSGRPFRPQPRALRKGWRARWSQPPVRCWRSPARWSQGPARWSQPAR